MALISVVLFLAVVAIVVGWKYGIERRPVSSRSKYCGDD